MSWLYHVSVVLIFFFVLAPNPNLLDGRCTGNGNFFGKDGECQNDIIYMTNDDVIDCYGFRSCANATVLWNTTQYNELEMSCHGSASCIGLSTNISIYKLDCESYISCANLNVTITNDCDIEGDGSLAYAKSIFHSNWQSTNAKLFQSRTKCKSKKKISIVNHQF